MTSKARSVLAVVCGLWVVGAALAAAPADGHLWCIQSHKLNARWADTTSIATYPQRFYAFLLPDAYRSYGLMVGLAQFTTTGSEYMNLIEKVYAGPMRPAYYFPFTPTSNVGVAALSDRAAAYRVCWYLDNDADEIIWELPSTAPSGLDTLDIYASQYNQCGKALIYVKAPEGAYVLQTNSANTYNASGGLLDITDPIKVTLDTALGPGYSVKIMREAGKRVYFQAMIAYDADGVCSNVTGESRYMAFAERTQVNVHTSGHEWAFHLNASGGAGYEWIGSRHNTAADGNGKQDFTGDYAAADEYWTEGAAGGTPTEVIGTVASPYGFYWVGDVRLTRESDLYHTSATTNKLGDTTEEYKITSSQIEITHSTTLTQNCTSDSAYGAMFPGLKNGEQVVRVVSDWAAYDVVADSDTLVQFGATAKNVVMQFEDAGDIPVALSIASSTPAPTQVYFLRSASYRKFYSLIASGGGTLPSGTTLATSYAWGPAVQWSCRPQSVSGAAGVHSGCGSIALTNGVSAGFAQNWSGYAHSVHFSRGSVTGSAGVHAR